MFVHLSPLLGYIGVPLANIIAPLIIWQIKKDDMPFVSINAKQCLNFQISLTIYVLISVILIFLFVGVFLLIAIGIASLIFTIRAALKARDGELYKYPLTITFIR